MPSYNHTRADGPYDPCPECLPLMCREDLLAYVKDLQSDLEDRREYVKELQEELKQAALSKPTIIASADYKREIERIIESYADSDASLPQFTVDVKRDPDVPGRFLATITPAYEQFEITQFLDTIAPVYEQLEITIHQTA